MKKFRIGKRLLAGLLALIMVVSLLPLSVLAALGDLRDGETGLDKDIDTRDTISWPIKIYDYLNDGLLFEYAAAQDSSLSNLGGDAYGGGAKMPGKIFYEGEILGSDFTVNSTESSEYYDGECYDYWFRAKSNYNATYAQQGSGTAGAFKFLRLRPWLTTTNMQDIVISDFTNDRYYYLDGTTSYPRDRVRYAVVVYKTAVSGLQLTLGMSTNRTGSKTVKDYNNSNVVGPNGYYVDYDVSATQSLQVSNSWNYLIVDMKSGTNATVWNDITKVYQITLGTNMENSSQDLDLSHIAYFSDAEEAVRFAEAAKAFSNNPGEYLPDQYYTANGSTYSKHWNMGNNQAFTMLYASSGGGWQNSYTGGTNSWENGYYSYQIGKHTGTGSWATGINGYRNTAKSNGYPVSDNIFLYSVSSNKSHSLSQYDFGYTLFNEITSKGFAQVMTAGLLQNDLISVKGVDGQTYRIPEYKQDAVEYIAKVLQQALAIGQKDRYGNYNYNFVQGSVSSQFADANGNKRDLASALREALGLTGPSSGKGNYTVPSSAKGGSYAATKANQEKLIGPYALVKGNIKTFYDAAFYLMHNLFVDDSYNQLQNDYNYLVLSKAPVTETGKEAYVFDAGFTTGNIESDSNSTSAVVYNKENGTISLNSAVGKDEICYGNEQWTTRNPFLPVTDAEGDYGCTGTPYFRDDGARIYADYGNTYVNRNYNYVMQANAEFVYHYQDDLFFQFEGDDDVYLFVNGELVLDIGAAHSITAVKMQMNDYVLQAQKELSFLKQDYGYRPYVSDEKFEQILDAAEKNGALKEDRDYYRRWHHLNLVDGENYPIDFYYMERHGWGANMRVATNILMTDPSMITEKKAYQDGAEIKYGGIVDETELVEYGFSITNEGNNKLYNLTFNDYELGLTLSPEKGLSFANANINGTTLCDARGQKLDPNDLIVYVTGYEDEEKTKPVSIRVRFDSQDANGELKQFLRDLSSNDGTDDEDTADLFAGNGLWRHGTVTVRGIYYRMTQEQIEAEEFNNIVFTTANPAVDSDLVLNSADTHQIRLIGDARHIYQWREHDVYFTRDDLVSWLGGSVKLNNKNYSASQIKIDTCRKDGTTYDFPDIIVRNNQTMTVNYWDAGTQLFFIKVFRDTNNDGVADDLNSDGKLNETDFMIVPLAVFVTDLQDDAVVLDYGLKAELTGKNGIISNDYITVPNLNTGYSIMGMGQEDPAYLSDTSNLSRKNYNRISFKPVDGRSIAYSDGIYEYTVETNDDKLYFTPNDFMDEEYSVYIAVTVHELDINPSAVGGINSSSVQHSIDITKEVQMYQKVTVLPASVMYYENDFPGLIYASDIETVISGTGSHVLQQGVDQTVNYGADQVYQTKDNAQFSGNSMTAVRVTGYGKVAQFNFKGTGFEIISRTNAFDSASFVVTVKKDGKVIRTLPVITEFSNNVDSVCDHNNQTDRLTVPTDRNYMYTGTGWTADPRKMTWDDQILYFDNSYSKWENIYVWPYTEGVTLCDKWPGILMSLETDNIYSADLPEGVTQVILHDGTGQVAAPSLPENGMNLFSGSEWKETIIEKSWGDQTFYYDNTDTEWENVYIWVYGQNGTFLPGYAGVPMNKLDGNMYSIKLPAGTTKVILNDAANQTPALYVPVSSWRIQFDGSDWVESTVQRSSEDQTLYFENNTGRTLEKCTVGAYSNEGRLTDETEMNHVRDNIYSFHLPVEATYFTISDETGLLFTYLSPMEGQNVFDGDTWWHYDINLREKYHVVYYDAAQTGWSSVTAYIYNADGLISKAWPGMSGTNMGEGIYRFLVPKGATHIVFKNGGSGGNNSSSVKEIELELATDGNNCFDGNRWWSYDANQKQKYHLVYFDATSTDWEQVYAFVYGQNGILSNEWPGTAMKHEGNKIYFMRIPEEATKVVFNNGVPKMGVQTLSVNSGNLFDGTSWWGYDANANQKYRAVMYRNTVTKWENLHVYGLKADGTQLSPWPGISMNHIGDNIYTAWIPADATRVIFNGIGHQANGHCNACGSYVGHTYYQDVCSVCGQNRLDYYLVGYINGADYGCEGDYENMGQYKFVNGKLTATFKTDGYVFLKTTGNTSYFMTDGYPGANVTSAYFYNTTSPGLEADKLHVPGGVELTFTLVENNDGTLTLSYTTSNDDVTDQDKIVYFNNTDDWSEVYAYYWSNTDATMVDWPGVSMTRTEDKDPIYTMELPADAEYVIFTDGGSNQTMDLTVPADKMVYSFSGFNKGWSVYNPGKTTLNFDNSASKWSKVYIHYWSDQDKQMIQWPGVEMTAGADNIYTTAIPSNATAVLFHNGDGTQTADLNILTNGDTYIYGTGWASQESGDAVRTVYFKNTANWGNLHVHYWEEGSEGNLVAWPGDAMIQQDGDIYKASIPANATHVIFNNGTDTAQTMNLELQEDLNLFVYDKTLAESVPIGSWSVYGSMELPDEPETVTSRRVYLINTGNWSVPYAHYWVDGGESTSWPGVKMTRVEGNLYSVEVSLETDFIIFNNGSGTQTGNLPLVDGLDTYDYQKNIWSGTETKTIYLENNTGWATSFAHFWFGDDSQKLSIWPGVQMTKVQDNRYRVEIPVVATAIIFNNGSGSQTADLTLTSGNDLYNLGTDVWSSTGTQEETPVTTTRTVYYDNNKAWEKVYVYYWALGNESMIQWPGVEMTADENGVYAAQIPSNARYVIFNNFAGGQTSDLTLPTDANYYSCPAPACGTWEQYEAKRVLYFDAGSSGWSQVNAYYWSMSGNPVGWPGVAMTKVSDTLYSITVPYNAEKVIFNDGSGNQTLDLTITDAYDKYSLDTGLWSCTTRVVYFEGSGAGSVRLTYSSDSMPAAKKIMTRVKNNIYCCEIPAESKYVTFEDGTAVTGPVILSDDHDLYTSDGWQIFDPAADYRSVIYFENTQGWEDVYVHYWGTNINATTWPGLPMTFVDDRIYMINVPAGAEGVVFNNGDLIGTIRQTVDLTLPEGNDLFTLAATGANGTWSKYAKTKNDAIHQVPALRVDGLELGEYTVEIQGMPTYTDDVDWTHMQDFVKETYLYIDGIRIYQPLGSTHEKYLTAENGATVQELRNLILEGHAAVAVYDHGTTAYTGNVSWTENRNGTGGDMETVYMGNQLSGIDDYLLLGPNNETYLNGNAQTQAVIFYVKETEGKNHALQIAARGIDSGLFLGSTSAGVNATLYHGVYIENPDGTIGYGWRPMDTVLSGTEQYYTVKYQDCPYLIDENGTKIYQVALFVRNGMVSFTNVKFVGLDLQSRPVGDATELQMYNGTIYVEDEENGIIGGSQNDINKLMIGNKLLSMSIQMNATQWIEEDEQAIALKYPALSFEDEIYYNVFFTLPELTEQPVEMGLLMFDTLEEDGTIYDAAAVISGVTEIGGMYVARSQGIQAKDLGKTLYFRVFAQLADGSYVYSKAASYSARQYANAILEGDYSAETKSLIAAMLKYSEAARSYFGGAWTLGDLITEDVDALVTDYRTDLLANAAKPDAAKAGVFAATSTGFTKKAPAVSFDGAFAINYFFTPSTTVQGDMTLYYWDAEDYENAAELTADNATGSMVMNPGDRYSAAITDIAAKDLDSTYYVAVVYQSNGRTYCSGVLAYSLASYCNSKATAEGSIGELAKATAVYGYHAKQLFG